MTITVLSFLCSHSFSQVSSTQQGQTANKKAYDEYDSYSETYLFGGFSSQKKNIYSGTLTVNGLNYPFSMDYKNTGLGGIGASWLYIGKNRRPDLMLDLEASLYGAKMTTYLDNPPVNVTMSGLALCADMHFSIFPIKARNNYPSPFVFAGVGFRVLKLSSGTTSASEVHGELPFGLGVRQKISRVVSFAVRERFVYSTLKDVGGFILPETRFELVLSFGK